MLRAEEKYPMPLKVIQPKRCSGTCANCQNKLAKSREEKTEDGLSFANNPNVGEMKRTRVGGRDVSQSKLREGAASLQ